VKAIVLLFALVMVGVGSAEASVPCRLPLYVEAVHATAHGAMNPTENLFLYGLKSAVTQHQGCIVDKITDAQLGLYITTQKIANDGGRSDSSVVAVTLAVPLNGVPVYMDNYVLIIHDADNVDEPVTELLESIGATLDRHSSPGQ
jgi:O6-methylguanine-DNA--protein-cysteine methyltransferase